MWFIFIVAVLCGIILLYLPGALLLRSFRLSLLGSSLFAPPVTVALYGVLAIIYSGMGVRSSWITLFLFPSLIALILMLVSSIISRRAIRSSNSDAVDSGAGLSRINVSSGLQDCRRNWFIMLLYVAVGVAVTGHLFIKCLDGADSVSQLFDNAWHLGIIRKFVDTGNYSTLVSGDIISTVGSKFYPVGWHSLVALVISMTGASIGIAENAVIAMLCAIVFPVSMFVLFHCLFAGRTKLIAICSLTPLMFAAFPWRYITFGPLYSNLLSFAITPLAMTLLIKLLESVTQLKDRICLGALFLVSIVGIAIAQPNAVFTIGILIAPFLYAQIPAYLEKANYSSHVKCAWSVAAWIVISLLIVAIWMFLYKAQFMQRTVTWGWPSFEGKAQAFIDIAFVGFRLAEPQILLGLLVLTGVIYTLLRREHLWISVSYAIICALYALSSSTDGRAKNVLTGFWYHDSYRLGASAVFFGAVLAGLGIYVCLTAVQRLLRLLSSDSVLKYEQRMLTVVMIVAINVVVFFPSYSLPGRYDVTTAFGAIRRDVTFWNSLQEPKSYSADERRFVERVKKVVPSGAVVLNQPYDGSAYAYGLDDLNVYYKAWEGNWMGKPTRENQLISTKLNEITSDSGVKEAVKSTGARYLILLDRSDYTTNSEDPTKMTSMYASYIKSSWHGIDAINDDSSGFTKVLEQGDMRLYRID